MSLTPPPRHPWLQPAWGAAQRRGERWALPVSSPNDNQPGRRGWGGVEEGARPAQTAQTTISCSAADGGGPPSGGGGRRWDGVPHRGVAPPCGKAVPVRGRRRRYRRRRPPRARRRSCTAGTWQRQALCMLDRVEWYRERSSPEGGWWQQRQQTTMTSGAHPPKRGGTGPPRGGGGQTAP